MMDNALITLLQKELSTDLQDSLDEKELLWRVKEKVSELIEHDFKGLILILYRIDVSELKLRQLLKTSEGMDAALIISNLIIERQMEKMKRRYDFKDDSKEDDQEEKW